MDPVRQRLPWLDLLRGTACILVVYAHATGFSAALGVPTRGSWLHVAQLFDAFRMPVFFFIAGLLSTSIVSRAWRQLLRGRVAALLWVYAVWCVLHAVIPFVLLGRSTAADWNQMLLAMIWPQQNLWFLWALALYLLVARALRPAPVVIQVFVAMCVSLPAQYGWAFVDPLNPAVGKTAQYVLPFLVALHLRPRLLRINRVRWWESAVLLVAFLVAAEIELQVRADGGATLPLLTMALAISAGIALAQVLSRMGWSKPLRQLGTRTLPVYCAHFLPAGLVPTAFAAQIAASPMQPIWPLVMTAGSLSVSLLLFQATRRVPGLWGLPSFGKGRPSLSVREPNVTPGHELPTSTVAIERLATMSRPHLKGETKGG